MTEQVCDKCGGAIRGDIAAGLCTRCLMVRALPQMPEWTSAPADAPPFQGVGPFTLLEEIARGGMGIVYRAREQPLGRMVALKLLRGGQLSDRDFLARFHNEARAASSLIHPHIVPVYAFGEDDGRWYIAMRLMEGGSLADWIRTRNSAERGGGRGIAVKHREAAVIVRKLAEAVHYAHERGILHRDLKPENVLLDTEGEPFLTDFGLARLNEADARVTRSHISLGTPAYIAPEVVREGSSQATVSSDVYGLGALFYELLAGRPPFAGATPLEVLRQVTDSEPRLPSTISKPLHRDLETICLKAMAKDPKLRYESCAALAKDLNRWLAGEPIQARPTGLASRALMWARRRPVTAGLLLLLSVSLLVNAIGSWIVNRNLRVASERQRTALVQSSVDAANRLLSQHDPVGSLSFQIDAIRLESPNPEREEMQRRRLALSLPEMPRLDRVWTHDDAVNTVAFSPDGGKVLSASDDGTARIWDVAGGTAPLVIKHEKAVTQAMFSPDGRRLLTLCRDGLARCWDPADGRLVSGPWPISVSYYHMPLNPNASFSPDGRSVITVSPDGLKIWNVETGEPAMPPLATSGDYNNAAFSPDGNRVVAARANGAVEIWELETGGARLGATYRHAANALYAIFSPDGRLVVSIGADCKAALWRADNAAGLATLFHRDPASRISQALFAPRGGELMTLSFDGAIRLWDGATGAPLPLDMNHPKGVADARWDPAGQRIVTASFDGMTRVWDARNAQIAGALLPHGRYVVDAMFSPSGKSIATACMDNRVRLWSFGPGVETIRVGSEGQQPAFQSPDGSLVAREEQGGFLQLTDVTKTGTPVRKLRHASRITLGAFAPMGDRIVALTAHGGIYLWDARAGTEIVPARDAGMYFGSLAFDPAGGRFATTAGEAKPNGRMLLTIWNAQTLAAKSFPIEHDTGLNHIEFSLDGRLALTSSARGLVRVHDVETGREIPPAIDLGKESGAAHFSPDGRSIATVVTGEGFSAGAARLWSTATHQQIGRLMAHEDGVPVCLFSPTGDRLATGGEDYTARIWSVPTGQPLTPPMAHGGVVRLLLFTRDGKILATASPAQVRLWDVQTGNPLMPAQEIPGGFASMQFAADSSQLLVVGGDGNLRRWDFGPARQSLAELEHLSAVLGGAQRGANGQSATPVP